jgi:beta-lactamase class D
MSNAVSRLALAALIAPLALAGCAPPPRDRVDQDRLNNDIDQSIGGLGTCVILLDTQTGRKVYQYGKPSACSLPLPPCETFEPAVALIALDAGLVTPQMALKWDKTPQPTAAWQTDADMKTAFDASIGWWFGRLSQQIGHAQYVARLKAFDYGDKNPDGPIDRFWQGPAARGGLTISAAQQAGFMRRMFAGKLPVKPASVQAVEAVMLQDSHGDATMTALPASCSDEPDHSRGVGWWVGRLKSPQRDLTFAAVVEAAAPPPGSDIGDNLKAIFADARLWSAGT